MATSGSPTSAFTRSCSSATTASCSAALGSRASPATTPSTSPCPPTWSSCPGSFYVTDGYENSRVVRFSPAGEYLDSWGRRGSGPGELNLPHGIAWDADATLYVADRGNRRIQAFDLDGEFQFAWASDELGRPFGVDVAPSGDIVVIDGGDLPATGPDRSRVVVVSPEGEVRASLGSFGSQDGQFRLGHDVAVASDGTIYVVDAWGRRVQKFVGLAYR